MRRPWLLPALSVLVACASPSALVRSRPPGPTEVRIPVAPGQADAVFTRAVGILEARGYPFVECDDGRSRLRTDRAEADAPCEGTSCLVRQRVLLKVGWRRLALTLRREFWDAASRGWVEARDEVSRSDVERELRAIERALADADLSALAHARFAHGGAVCHATPDPGAAHEPDPVAQVAVPVATR